MALNIAEIGPGGTPRLWSSEEVFLNATKGIDAEITAPDGTSMSANGTLFLSNYRMVFAPAKQSRQLSSFGMPVLARTQSCWLRAALTHCRSVSSRLFLSVCQRCLCS
jgi:hypothetical protein